MRFIKSISRAKLSVWLCCHIFLNIQTPILIRGAQWLSGRVLDLRPRGCRFEPHGSHCVVVLEQDTFILA